MAGDLELLGERIAEQAAHLDAAMHRLLADLRTFDEGGGWAEQGARSCAHWLSWRVGWGLGTAREHLRTAHALATLPVVDRELEHGRLSYSKVRAITRVATPANEETLVEQAKLATASQLETICRKYATVRRQDAAANPDDDYDRRRVSRMDLSDGLVRITAVLHPDEAAAVWAALEHGAKQLRRHAAAQTRADAAAETCAAEARADARVKTCADVRGEPHAYAAAETCADVPAETRPDATVETRRDAHAETCMDVPAETCAAEARADARVKTSVDGPAKTSVAGPAETRVDPAETRAYAAAKRCADVPAETRADVPAKTSVAGPAESRATHASWPTTRWVE